MASAPQQPITANADVLRGMLRQLFLGAVGLIIVSGFLLALELAYLRGEAVTSGEKLTASYAQVIEEQTTRTLQTVDQRLQLVVAAIERLRVAGSLNEDSTQPMLQEQVRALPFVRLVVILGPDGVVKYASQPEFIGLDLSDRSYFQEMLLAPESRFLISDPVIGRSSKLWTIFASRPLTRANGTFAGVAAIAIEPRYFDKLWSSVPVGDGGAVTLFRRHGMLMTRSPFDDAAMGKTYESGPIFREMLPKSPSGSLLSTSDVDGIYRSYAYRTLSAQPDFLITVGRSMEMVLAPWRRLAFLAAGVWAAAVKTVEATFRTTSSVRSSTFEVILSNTQLRGGKSTKVTTMESVEKLDSS